MTVYGRGYRPFTFEPTSPRARLWAVAELELRTLFRTRLGLMAFLICLGPSIANLGILLIFSGVWRVGASPERLRSWPRTNPEAIDFYLQPIIGDVFAFVIFLVLTSLVSCRAIAKDRESNALELYWTRGVGPRGYFFAKWLGSVLLLGSAFVVAPAVTWLLGVLMAPDWGTLERTIEFVPSVLLALTVFTAVISYLAVAFSAVAATANTATVFWFFLLLGTAAATRVLSLVFVDEWWFKALSPWDAAKRVAEWICGYVPRRDYNPAIAVLSLVVVVGVLTALALRRLRRAEAVG
ncbi:MAG: ABC transporter permease [Planctomycetota bacterium]